MGALQAGRAPHCAFHVLDTTKLGAQTGLPRTLGIVQVEQFVVTGAKDLGHRASRQLGRGPGHLR